MCIRDRHCRHRGWGRHNCGHDEDVSVSCRPTIVRLVGGSDPREGRLEVYHNGTWGTVCNDYFTSVAARVVCYMLGYQDVGHVVSNRYGAGSGPIWLDNVQCNGTETSVTDCRHNGWGTENCGHYEDVSVSCRTIVDSADATALVGGGNPRVGRLEVFHGTQWGTVCDDGFTDADARVVCYSLGFGYVGRKVDINLYGVGDGLIWLNRINCWETEEYVGKCSHGGWKVQNCSHRQDVAVSCIDNSSAANVDDSTTSVTPVRLVGGSSSTGRLEVRHNGVWGTVCGDFVTDIEPRVVCIMLGFDSGTQIDNHKYTTGHGPIWLNNVRCNGTETDIAECSHSGWGVDNCQHRDDVAVSCTRVQVRLNGGRDPREGRLEVLYNGKWRSVCTGEFNHAAARVVCNMLGFGYIGRSVINTYGYGPGPFWLDSVQCNGTEKTIAECVHDDWYHNNCSSGEQQAVSCLTDDAVALFGGGSPRKGRLEVYHNGTWGTICNDGFTDVAAGVVCYSLGLGYFGRATDAVDYGLGMSVIWLQNVRCDGTEAHISECSHGRWGVHNCGHKDDVAVSCFRSWSKYYKPTTAPTVVYRYISHCDHSIRTYVYLGIFSPAMCIFLIYLIHSFCKLLRKCTEAGRRRCRRWRERRQAALRPATVPDIVSNAIPLRPVVSVDDPPQRY